MTNEREIRKWREKLKPYINEIAIKLYIEGKNKETLIKLKENETK